MTKTLTFTLTVPEAKRLIAQGISELPIIKKALEDHTLVLAHGIGNAYIYEALTATKIIDKSTYTAGIVVDGVACISGANPRMSSLVMRKGVQVEEDWLVALTKFGPNDVFIKGANSFDPSGMRVFCSEAMVVEQSAKHMVIFEPQGVTLLHQLAMKNLFLL